MRHVLPHPRVGNSLAWGPIGVQFSRETSLIGRFAGGEPAANSEPFGLVPEGGSHNDSAVRLLKSAGSCPPQPWL
jgi:hypothetical protein